MRKRPITRKATKGFRSVIATMLSVVLVFSLFNPAAISMASAAMAGDDKPAAAATDSGSDSAEAGAKSKKNAVANDNEPAAEPDEEESEPSADTPQASESDSKADSQENAEKASDSSLEGEDGKKSSKKAESSEEEGAGEKAGKKAEDDGDATLEDGEEGEEEEEEDEEEPVYEAGSLSAQLKSGYTVEVSYDADAEIPEDSELVVSKLSEDAELLYADELDEALDLGSDYALLFSDCLDISIVSDKFGEVKPSAPVCVEITLDDGALPDELLDVSDEIADTLAVAHFDENGDAVQVKSEVLGGGSKKSRSQVIGVSFETDSFSVFALASIANRLADWVTDYLDMEVYSLLSATTKLVERKSVKGLEDGTEVLEAYDVSGLSSLVWLDWTFTKEVELGKYGSLDVYALSDGALGSVLAESSFGDGWKMLSLLSYDGFALVQDSGLRETTLSAMPADGQQVSVSGRVPVEATLSAEDVMESTLEEYENALAAYDITINDRFGEFQPEDGDVMTVSIENGDIGDVVENGGKVEVLHIAADGTGKKVDSSWDDGYLTFEADGFSTYVVLEAQLTETVTASDGSTYEISVTYKESSGVPMEGVELLVTELVSGDDGYDDYMSAAAEQVGATAENIGLSKAFDIKIVDADDHSMVYEPEGDVDVSIRMLGANLDDYANVDVLHFVEGADPDEAEIRNMDSSVVDGETVQFTTDSFSVYVVIGHEDGDLVTPRLVFHYINYEHTITYPDGIMTYSAEPYNFMNQGSEYLATQTLKSGESLTEVPTPPVYNQQYFNGWYVVDMTEDNSSFNTTSRRFTGQISYTMPNNPTRQTFNESIPISLGAEDANGVPVTWTMNGQTYTAYADEEGCVHVYLAPLYANFNYVNFFDYNGNLIARRLLVLDSSGFSSMLVSDMEATSPIDVNHYFMGWSSVPYQSGSANPQTVSNTIPLYEDGYKKTIFITLYGGTDYHGVLDIYYGDDGYSSVSELAAGTLKFDDFDTASTNGDVNLYAEYEDAHWLRFIAGESGWGSLYVPANYLVGNQAATRLPTTSRPGYQFAGWYSGYQDANGAIWYYEQISDSNGNVLSSANRELIAYAPPDSDPSNNITVTNYQGTTDSIDYTQTGSITSTGLTMTQDSYLFARWTSNDTAQYKVIIWQQKITDDKNSPDKHYDYVNSYIETAPATSIVTLPSSSEYLNRTYTGFHLSGYDQGVWIDPQGTSAVNVYYDRDLTAVNFYYTTTNLAPSDAVTAYQYTVTTGNTGTQYGIVNDQYQQLSYNSATGKWMAPEYVYQPQIDNTNGTFGLVNGEYVKISPVYNTTTRYTADYRYTQNDSSTNNLYGLVNGEYEQVYRIARLYSPDYFTTASKTDYYWNGTGFSSATIYHVDGTYYRTRSGWGTYTYSNEVIPYSRSGSNTQYYYYLDGGAQYTGSHRYTRANDGTTDVTNDPSLNVVGSYYLDSYGGKVPVTAHTTTTIVGYTYDDDGTPTPYTGDRYSFVLVPTGDMTVYDQTRFTRSNITGGNNYRMVTWSGLYGQTLAQNGYNWSDVASYTWNEGITSSGTGQTYLEAFVRDENPYNLRTTAESGNNVFYHYRQRLDGTYSLDDREEVHSSSASFTFYFSNKFNAFTVSTYSTGAEGFSPTGGSHAATDGSSTSMTTPFHVYHQRKSYNLTFATNYPGDARFTGTTASTNFDLPGGVLYEQPLTTAQYATPTFTAPDYYVFDGWYEDASGTIPFDWTQTMPAANKVVYAKWYPVYYRVEIDPAGGVLAGAANQNQSTYFWLQHGQTVGQYTTKREYIEATPAEAAALGASGTYYYRYVSPTINANGTVAEHSKWDPWPNVTMWESNLESDKDAEGIRPSYNRLAEYIKVEDYHTANDTFYQSLLNSGLTPAQANAWDARYVDTTTVYRPVTGSDPTWVFVGWYKDGEPYDFNNAVTEDITLTAVWRQAGTFFLHYNAEMANGGVVGTLTGAAYDPGDPSAPDSPGYIDKAVTRAATAPEDITGPVGDNHLYVFEGWRAVDPSGNPLDENGNVMTEAEFEANATRYLFQPGDEIVVRSEQARLTDDHLVIELRAYYSRIEDSSRYPKTVQLVLDANDDYDGYIDPSAAAWPAWANPGVVAVNTTTELDSQSRPTQIVFGDAQENQVVHLSNYLDFFGQERGDFLLGFDTQPDPELCENGPYIPKYSADAVIGFDDPEATNILYAIWEPMVYTTFINHTGAPVTISLDSLSGVAVIEATIVNNATQTYDRVAITAMDSVTVESGQTLRLVLPQGMDLSTTPETGRSLTFTVHNNHAGFKMSATKQIGDGAPTQLFGGDPEDPSAPALEYGQATQETQAMIRNYTGIIYTFTEQSLPYAYFDPNGGTWTDSAHTTTSTATWGSATKPNGRVFLQTAEQGVGRDQYKIQIAQFMKPASDPTKSGDYEFLGWTTDENVARFTRVNGNFGLTIAELAELRDSAGVGTDDYAMYDALLTLTEEYKAAYNITEVTHLLAVVENYSLWNFENAPAGTTYYAVYAQTARVNYHIMLAGGNNNHIWGLPVSGSTSTGQAGTVYTRTSVNEPSDNNRSHYVWYRNVVKGRSIIKPPAPTYYNNNSNYTFLYWLEDDPAHTSGNTDPSSIVAFSFSEPITDTVDLYTSWTEMNYTTLRAIKMVDGSQSSTSDMFNLRYNVVTYKYSYMAGQTSRSEYGEVDTSGIVLQGTTTSPGTEIQNYRDIRLYYWTDADGSFYCQALRIHEENLAESGYELVITDNEGRTSEGSVDGAHSLIYVNNETGANYYRYHPVSNHYVEDGSGYNINYAGEKNNKPVWRFQKDSYDLYFWNNTWYTDYQCNTPATSAQQPHDTQTATFTNTKNAKIRFVKTDENGYDRLNGATFTISKVNGSGTATSQVLTFHTANVRTITEASGRNGRFSLAAGETIDANSPVQMDTDHNELVFTETGTYRLTETVPPTGYDLPSATPSDSPLHGVDYVDIVVTASGISIGGGNTAIADTEPLAQLNIGEFDRANEYAVVVKDAPRTTYFKLQKVDTSGSPILTGVPDEYDNPTSGLATFTVSGTAASSGVWVTPGSFNTIITGSGAAAYTDVLAVPSGTYTVTETTAPVGYRTADATRVSITEDSNGDAVLTAHGGNVYGTVTGSGTQANPFVVKVQDEEIGYNMEVTKTVVNDPEDGVERVYSVTVAAQGDTVAKIANKTYNVVKLDASNVSTNTSVTFNSSGRATITIKENEKVTLRSLPRGSYVVSEAATAINENTGLTDPVPYSTSIVVVEPATSHTLVTSTTNTTSPFTFSNNVSARFTNTFGHTMTISKAIDGGAAVLTDEFPLRVNGAAITHYTYSGSRSDDGGQTFTVMNFTATPTTGATPGYIEFTMRNNNPVNGGPITGNTVLVINGVIDGNYTIAETIRAGSGYVLTAKVDGVNVAVSNNTFPVTVQNADVAVSMTNTCKSIAPTSFEQTSTAYQVALALAGMMLACACRPAFRRRWMEGGWGDD